MISILIRIVVRLFFRTMRNGQGSSPGLARLLLGGSAVDFWLGLIMYLVGLALTVNRFVTTFSIGGFINGVFYTLTVAGIIRMMVSTHVVLGISGERYYGPGGDALPFAPMEYVAPPSEMPPGLCWQCGARVKPDRVICMQCGATQPVSRPEPSEAAQAAGFDGTFGSSAIPQQASPMMGPPPSRGLPSGTYRAGIPGGGILPGAMPSGAMPPGRMPPGAMPPGGMPPGGMPPGRPAAGWDPRMGGGPPGAMPPGGTPPGWQGSGWDPRMAGGQPYARYGRGGGPRPRARRRISFMPQSMRETADDLRDMAGELRERAGELREKAEGLLRPFLAQRARPGAGKGRRPRGYGYGPGEYGPPGYGSGEYRPRGFGSGEYGPPRPGSRGYGPRGAAPPGYGPRGGGGGLQGRGPREPEWAPEDEYSDDDWSPPRGKGRRGRY